MSSIAWAATSSLTAASARIGLALIQRLVGQGTLGPGQVGQVVGGNDAAHARQGQGPRGVDAAHTGVRHRAEKQLAEQHALGAEVFGVEGAAGDLGHEIRRRVVRADESFRHGDPSRLRDYVIIGRRFGR